MICVGKLALELGDDIGPPCEPIAWIWHKGNDPIRFCSIAITAVVHLDLREIHAIILVHWNIYPFYLDSVRMPTPPPELGMGLELMGLVSVPTRQSPSLQVTNRVLTLQQEQYML